MGPPKPAVILVQRIGKHHSSGIAKFVRPDPGGFEIGNCVVNIPRRAILKKREPLSDRRRLDIRNDPLDEFVHRDGVHRKHGSTFTRDGS
jgi:hypothetical protein